jgi:iron-sulfur cluster assembly accessory protein
MTETAIKKVQHFLAQDESLGTKRLRVFVEPGGCSGFSYGMAFDDRRDGDEEVTFDGFTVVIDANSLLYLKGVQIDYQEGIQGAGFNITNPNARSTCGCGHSFQA